MTSTTANPAAPANPLIGAKLGGKYKIESLIGRGGMGLVFLAKHRRRHVVVKMLAPHWADDRDAIARFDREGNRLSQLSHPNIVEMIEIGRHGSQAYIVMEYLDGEPLRRFLNRKKYLTIDIFAPIAVQILEGVAYAHRQGIMLRDIKPPNIMMCQRDGKEHFVKLLDFGLAKLVDGDDVEVTKAHVIGTAGYLAPEQIKGEPANVRVDVYALGILFFIMLAGKSPILGENDGAVLYNHVHGEPLRLETTLPSDHKVPAGVIALIHQCMAKDPAQRPAHAGEVLDAMLTCFDKRQLALPAATEETRTAIAEYKESRRRGDRDSGASSSEWTRPHLRKVLQEAAEAKRHPPIPAPRKTRPLTSRQQSIAPAHKPAPAKKRPPAPRTGRTAPVDQASPPVRVRPVANLREFAERGGQDATMMDGAGSMGTRLPKPSTSRTTALGAGSMSALPPPLPRSLRRTEKVPDPDRRSGPHPRVLKHTEPVSEPAVPLPMGPLPSAPPPSPGTVETPVSTSHSEAFAAPTQRARSPVAMGLVVAAVVAILLGGGLALVLFVDDPTPVAAAEDEAAVPSQSENDVRGAAVAPEEASQPVKTVGEEAEPADEGDEGEASPNGTIRIASVEGATITVDGDVIGTAPFSGSLPVGSYDARVEAEGYEPWESKIEVVEGQDLEIDAGLKRLRGRKARRAAAAAAARRGGSVSPGVTPRETKPRPKAPPKADEPAASTPDPFGKTGPAKKKKKSGGPFMEKKKPKDDIFLPVGKDK